MKDIAEKYPNTWELFADEYYKQRPIMKELIKELSVTTLFGYLVLEFFPKHGIVLSQNVFHNGWNVGERTFDKLKGEYETDWDDGDFDTPKEAIDKAFEILEKINESMD